MSCHVTSRASVCAEQTVWEQVWRHRIGSNADQDEIVYHEEDEQFYVHLGKSKDDKLLIIHVGTAHFLMCIDLTMASGASRDMCGQFCCSGSNAQHGACA